MKNRSFTHQLITGAFALAFVITSGIAFAGPDTSGRGVRGIAPPNSTAYGASLAQWVGIYWRWYNSGSDPATSVVNGVQLMPLPAGEQVSGSWTPEDPALLQGTLEITLKPGTPFVLPLFAWISERYNNGNPDDPPAPDNVILADSHPNLTIDGRTAVTDANKAAFYVPVTAFDPIVVYPAPTGYGSVAALFFQGDAVVVQPLSVGTHVIHLYEPLIYAAGDFAALPDGMGLIYDNTWIITVKP